MELRVNLTKTSPEDLDSSGIPKRSPADRKCPTPMPIGPDIGARDMCLDVANRSAVLLTICGFTYGYTIHCQILFTSPIV
jgi:hypothetical protein